MTKKRGICTFLIFVLVATFAFSGISYAETKGDLQEELNGVNNEKDQVSQRLSEVKSQIDEVDQQSRQDHSHDPCHKDFHSLSSSFSFVFRAALCQTGWSPVRH